MVKIPEKNDIDEMTVSFGKYKGKTPSEICEIDPHYIVWAYENIGEIFCSKDLYMCAEMDAESYSDLNVEDTY